MVIYQSSMPVAFDRDEPCKQCPFLKTTPADMKGVSPIEAIGDLIKLGDAAHTCHLTDARSDCESAQSYSGGAQHCMGFTLMLLKSKMTSRSARLHALYAGSKTIKRQLNSVHTAREVLQILIREAL